MVISQFGELAISVLQRIPFLCIGHTNFFQHKIYLILFLSIASMPSLTQTGTTWATSTSKRLGQPTRYRPMLVKMAMQLLATHRRPWGLPRSIQKVGNTTIRTSLTTSTRPNAVGILVQLRLAVSVGIGILTVEQCTKVAADSKLGHNTTQILQVL
jgi:hypothetical protein